MRIKKTNANLAQEIINAIVAADKSGKIDAAGNSERAKKTIDEIASDLYLAYGRKGSYKSVGKVIYNILGKTTMADRIASRAAWGMWYALSTYAARHDWHKDI